VVQVVALLIMIVAVHPDNGLVFGPFDNHLQARDWVISYQANTRVLMKCQEVIEPSELDGYDPGL